MDFTAKNLSVEQSGSEFIVYAHNPSTTLGTFRTVELAARFLKALLDERL